MCNSPPYLTIWVSVLPFPVVTYWGEDSSASPQPCSQGSVQPCCSVQGRERGGGEGEAQYLDLYKARLQNHWPPQIRDTHSTAEVLMLLCCLLGNLPPRARISPEIAAALNCYCWCYLPFKMVLDASPGTQRIKHA